MICKRLLLLLVYHDERYYEKSQMSYFIPDLKILSLVCFKIIQYFVLEFRYFRYLLWLNIVVIELTSYFRGVGIFCDLEICLLNVEWDELAYVY